MSRYCLTQDLSYLFKNQVRQEKSWKYVSQILMIVVRSGERKNVETLLLYIFHFFWCPFGLNGLLLLFVSKKLVNISIYLYTHIYMQSFLNDLIKVSGASLMAQLVKNLPAMQEILVWSLGWEDPLEKGKATHSSVVAWRIPWMSPWGRRVGHDWATFTFTFHINVSMSLIVVPIFS